MTKNFPAYKNHLRSMVWSLTQAKKLTGSAHKVLMQLIAHLTPSGCYPSQTTLAAEAGCSTRTVVRAIQAAEELGVLQRAYRSVKEGHRNLRTSNAYSFITDAAQQLQQAAQALLEQAHRKAQALRSRYKAFLGLSDNATRYSGHSITKGPERSTEQMLEFIKGWAEERK